MGSTFGAVRKKEKSRIKIFLGTLLGLLVLALVGLIWMVQNPNYGHAVISDKNTEEEKKEDNNVGILVPLFRIESGQKITDGMLKVKFIDRKSLLPNAVMSDEYKDINSGNYYATRLIDPHSALSKNDISTTPPLSSIEIPSGYRLITILIDGRSGVEGYAKPGSRVDVLWTFTKDEDEMIGTLAHFVKVVSIGGNSQNNTKEDRVAVDNKAKTTASLLVTEMQAKYIELARSMGELSLTLVGGNEPNPETKELVFVKMKNILEPEGSLEEEEEDEDIQGVTYSTDPVTGKTRKHILKKGKWSIDKNYTE